MTDAEWAKKTKELNDYLQKVNTTVGDYQDLITLKDRQFDEKKKEIDNKYQKEIDLLEDKKAALLDRKNVKDLDTVHYPVNQINQELKDVKTEWGAKLTEARAEHKQDRDPLVKEMGQWQGQVKAVELERKKLGGPPLKAEPFVEAYNFAVELGKTAAEHGHKHLDTLAEAVPVPKEFVEPLGKLIDIVRDPDKRLFFEMGAKIEVAKARTEVVKFVDGMVDRSNLTEDQKKEFKKDVRELLGEPARELKKEKQKDPNDRDRS